MSSPLLSRAKVRQPTLTPVGLRLDGALRFDEWAALGQRIVVIARGSAWSLGDWLVYGEATYGERYRGAIEATQLDYQTLRNLAWVARAFELHRRRENLSFSHHAEVASLPQAEQELWLSRAQSLGWSRNELRRRLAVHHDNESRLTSQTVRVQLTPDRELRWREAAAAQDRPLADWMTHALDAAADAILSSRSGNASLGALSTPQLRGPARRGSAGRH